MGADCTYPPLATQPVSGTFWQTTQPVSGTFWQATQPVSGTFWQATQPVSGTVTANQGGTWTVQPGNTANTTAWKVDGSAVTQPVSGTFWQATQPVSGTFWQATQPVSLATAPTTPVTWNGTAPPIGAGTEATALKVTLATDSTGQVKLAAGTAAIGTVQPGNTANTTPWLVSTAFSTRSDTYTATGNGVTIDVSARPVQSFAIQVKGTGGAATTWDVRVEGSLDNTNFTQILAHTNTTGDGAVLFNGANLAPSLYIRSRAAGLVLGAATNVVVTILGR